MPHEPRILQLLEEILDSSRTPEEACVECPELLWEVRERLQQCRQVDAQIKAMFPSSGLDHDAGARPRGHGDAGLPRIPGYEVEAILGRGGMGVVYKAQHLKLRRPVAIKMILSGAYAGGHELVRFMREAEAVAGVRHAHIVQIYDVGDFDGRPYFTMEYVEGGSLAEKLAGVPLPASQAAALLATLASAVQAAHHGGVVHRDLKPANILLTADGTPKITDFGLARRFESDGELTLSGARIGTPSYMAPEQALGEAGAFCPSVDIYSLGAVLYEMLTGRPPFHAETAAETQRQLIAEEPAPPSRLNAKVPRDLETICLKCLHKDPKRRYAPAAALADDLRRFQHGEPIAARPAGFLERSGKWVCRRPALAVVLFGSVLAACALVGGGIWLAAHRADTARAVNGDLREVARLQQQSSWAEAGAALERAKARLGMGGPFELHQRLEQGERDLALVVLLDAIRLNRSVVIAGHFDVRVNKAQADRQYEAAFQEAGLGKVYDDPGIVAGRIEASNIRGALVTALDDWTCAAAATDPGRQGWLQDVARRADRDPTGWQNRFRDPAVWGDPKALTLLAETALGAKPPAKLLVALGKRLKETGVDAISFMKQVQQEHPEDFWANFTLGETLGETNPEEAIRYYQAAVAVRPEAAVAYNNLGIVLSATRRTDQAIGQFSRAVRIDPNFADAHYNLALVLKAVGRFDEAIDHLRHALRIDPSDTHAHYNLGLALKAKGRVAEAIGEYEKVLNVDPEDGNTHYNLALALSDSGKLDEAIGHYEQALRINPKHRHAHYNIGLALAAKGRSDDAIGHFERSLQLDPADALAHYNLALVLIAKGRADDAIDHYRNALRINPNDAKAHYNLGLALTAKGRPGDALGHYEEAVRLNPDDAIAQYTLGLALGDSGNVSEAIVHYEKALRVEPDHALAHYNLGLALKAQGRTIDAIGHYERALRSTPDDPHIHYNLGLALNDVGKPDGAIKHHRRTLQIIPKYAAASGAMGEVLLAQGRLLEARAALNHCVNLLPAGHARDLSEEQLRRCERFLTLESRCPGVLLGDDEPNPIESLEFAELFRMNKQYATSARFSLEAFSAAPSLAEGPSSSNRYAAARAAALAGVGSGADAAGVTEAERARWRRQSIEWLRADVAAWGKVLDSNPNADRGLIRGRLEHWRVDPDLAGVREPGAMTNLTPAEREDFLALWSQVNAVLNRAGALSPNPESPTPDVSRPPR